MEREACRQTGMWAAGQTETDYRGCAIWFARETNTQGDREREACR